MKPFEIIVFICLSLIILLAIPCFTNSTKTSSCEMYDENDQLNSNKRPPGPWGEIGTRHSWQDYPYVLNWINY